MARAAESCPVCSEPLRRGNDEEYDAAQMHLLEHLANYDLTCRVKSCGRKCGSRELMIDHVMIAHAKVDQEVCSFENCERAFWRRKDLRRHEKNHYAQ